MRENELTEGEKVRQSWWIQGACCHLSSCASGYVGTAMPPSFLPCVCRCVCVCVCVCVFVCVCLCTCACELYLCRAVSLVPYRRGSAERGRDHMHFIRFLLPLTFSPHICYVFKLVRQVNSLLTPMEEGFLTCAHSTR